MKTKGRRPIAKKRLWRLMPALIICVLLLAGCAQGGKDTERMLKEEDMPGGRRDWSNPDAPKTIVSKELISFAYEGALLDYAVCHFSLVRQDDGALCTGWGHEDDDVFDLEFMAELSSLDALQAVIDEYDLAKFNGIDITVNGLPPYLGDYLHAEYASGEKIFASNNQFPFVSEDARLALFRFFSGLANEAGSGFHAGEEAEAPQAYEDPYG